MPLYSQSMRCINSYHSSYRFHLVRWLVATTMTVPQNGITSAAQDSLLNPKENGMRLFKYCFLLCFIVFIEWKISLQFYLNNDILVFILSIFFNLISGTALSVEGTNLPYADRTNNAYNQRQVYSSLYLANDLFYFLTKGVIVSMNIKFII